MPTEPSPSPHSEILHHFAQQIVARGYATPAMLLFESIAPTSTILHSLTLLGLPCLLPFMGRERYDKLVDILEDPNAIEQLVSLIESEALQVSQGGAQ